MAEGGNAICPRCRAAIDDGANFCARCGYDLRTTGRLEAQPVPATASGSSVRARAATLPVPSVEREPEPEPEPDADADSDRDREPEEGKDPWIGRLVGGRYRVLARIGAGGMGLVYKVEHVQMGKIAAVKVLHRDLAGDKEVVRRFEREARAVAKLNHPNTVHTFDFGSSGGAMYLVMEYVRGEDLGAILKRDGAMSFGRAAPIFQQICGALGEAHELGIVHRDLKPENILVTRSKDGHDHAKVLDFGLAKLSQHEEANEVTGRGEIIGTPYYMSPEQVRGEELDHRSDIYSFGAVMYRMLTGEPPFQAQSPVGVLTKHLTEDLVPPSRRRPDLQIDDRVDEVVLRAMSKRREARYTSIDEVRGEVEALVEQLRREPETRAMRRAGSASDAGGPVHTPTKMERRHLTEGSTQEPRLRREDFDAFERSVKRGVWLRLAVLPLVAVAAAVGAWLYLHAQKPQPQRVEIEPNDDREQATLIEAGAPVRGTIGRRLAADKGDKDYYRLNVRGGAGGRVKLTARLSSIPNIDLALVVYDHTGKLLAMADNGGVGDPEAVPNLGVQDDVIYVLVMESGVLPPRVPTENLSDSYELLVTLGAPPADEELEPDDVDSDAVPLAAGAVMKGWLSRPDDVDCFRFAGADGKYDVEIAGADGVDVKLKAGEGEEHAGRKLSHVALKKDEIVRVIRVDPPVKEPGRRLIAHGTDEPYTIVISAAK